MLPAVGKQEVGGTGLKIEVIHSTSSIPKIKSSRDGSKVRKENKTKRNETKYNETKRKMKKRNEMK